LQYYPELGRHCPTIVSYVIYRQAKLLNSYKTLTLCLGVWGRGENKGRRERIRVGMKGNKVLCELTKERDK
jgi:hypothetical protein